jgi:hypothetical protein
MIDSDTKYVIQLMNMNLHWTPFATNLPFASVGFARTVFSLFEADESVKRDPMMTAPNRYHLSSAIHSWLQNSKAVGT